MNRELDVACARAMGSIVDMAGEVIDRHVLDGPRLVYFNDARDGYLMCPPVPPYSTDPAAARLLEDEIERRGLINEYLTELRVFLPKRQMYRAICWDFMRTTPEQRARAFLAAVGDTQ